MTQTSRKAAHRFPRPAFHATIIAIAIATAIYASLIQGQAPTRANFAAAAVAVPQAEVLSAGTSPLIPAEALASSPFGESAGLLSVPNDDLRISALNATTDESLISSEAAAALRPTPEGPPCDPDQSLIYCVYTVEEGDTLGGIAAKFGLESGEVSSFDYLVHSNSPDIVSADDFLQIGQQIRIPSQAGVIHTVISAQTLSEIGAIYDIDFRAIIDVPGNGISDVDTVTVGQELLIPNPTRLFQPPPPPPTNGAPAASRGTQQSASGFVWPTTGPISSYFSAGHPLGIDIDLYAAPNSPIYAAASGTVTFAGGNPCCSYGHYVIVDHGNGLQTLYAHLSQFNVSTGQFVSQGSVLGYGGSTGYSTGNHLHFEVHVGGSVVDPLIYLP